MDKKIKYIYEQKDLLKKYIKLIEDECEDFYITYGLDKEKEATLDDVEKYKAFYENLDKTCNSDVFKALGSFIYQVPKTCSFLTALSGDGGVTTYRVDIKTNKIEGCVSIDLPPYNRDSMDFIYLHEGVHGLYWDTRKGKEFMNSPNIEVLPYFFMLYALEHLHSNYKEETIDSIVGRFIANSYSSANNILYKLNNRLLHYSDEELKQNFRLSKFELESITGKKEELYLDYQQFLGPIKSIILYEYCLEKKISFDSVFDSVLDSEKEVGTELDYNLLDISIEDNFNIYKKFVKSKKMVLLHK